MNNNFNIAATRITDLVRVSSAAIWYEHDNRYQIETWIFSSDQRYKSTQVIHGSWYGDIEEDNPIVNYARTFHAKVVYKFNKAFNNNFRIEQLRNELEYYSNLKGNSKLKWEYIQQIENEIELVSKYLN